MHRRKFLHIATGGFAAVGLGAAAIPLVSSMMPGPHSEGRAFVDIGDLGPGEVKTVDQEGIYARIRHLTAKELASQQPWFDDRILDHMAGFLPVWPERPEIVVTTPVCKFSNLVVIPIGALPNADYCPHCTQRFDFYGRGSWGLPKYDLSPPPWAFVSPNRIVIYDRRSVRLRHKLQRQLIGFEV